MPQQACITPLSRHHESRASGRPGSLAALLLTLYGARRLATHGALAPEVAQADTESQTVELVAPDSLSGAGLVPDEDGAREVLARETEPETDDDPQGPATFIVQARWDDDGSPAPGIGVSTFDSTRANPFLHRQRDVTDSDGRASFEVRAPVEIRGYLDQGESGSIQLKPDEEKVLELTAERWAVVSGRVVDHEGNPEPDAQVWISAGSNYSNGSVVATTLGDGALRGAAGSLQLHRGAEGGPHPLASTLSESGPGRDRRARSAPAR